MVELSRETLMALVQEAVSARDELEWKLGELEREVEHFKKQRAILKEEEMAMRSAFTRRYGADELNRVLPPRTPMTVEEDWGTMPRTLAVLLAVQTLADSQDTVSPSDIEDFLARHGRDDGRDSIGAALAYLNKKGELRNVGRGMWVPVRDFLLSRGITVSARGDVVLE